MKDPILATRIIPCDHTRTYNLKMIVEGGLYMIKGNHVPYFTITCTTHRKGFPNQVWSGGCQHELVLKYYPRFADLVALHLLDIDGAPMHDEANAWYDLAGALPDHAGERYHAGNSQRHFPKPADKIDPSKPWDTTDYRNPTPEECLAIFADYVRVDIETAREVYNRVLAISFISDHGTRRDWVAGRAWLRVWIDEQRPRWKQEAEACIAKHGLVVYGDPWPAAPNAAMMSNIRRDVAVEAKS